MSKPYRDPATGKFAKKPANPSTPLPPNAASTSSRSPLVFPTPRSHPIPGSFDSPASPVYSLDASDSESSRSPSKLPSFFDTLSLSPDPHSLESQSSPARLAPFDDTETSVPVSRSIVNALDRLADQGAQEPSPTFAYAQPSPLQLASTSSSSATPSSVSSVSTSQSSSPALAPQTSSPGPAFAPGDVANFSY